MMTTPIPPSAVTVADHHDPEEEWYDAVLHPEVFGPGVWWTLHIEAARAVTIEKKLQFIERLKTTIEFLPCEKCRAHAKEYVAKNPVSQERYMNRYQGEEDIGMSYYVWEFHEVVNKRLGKPSFDWKLVIPRYRYGEKRCSQPTCSTEAQVVTPANRAMPSYVVKPAENHAIVVIPPRLAPAPATTPARGTARRAPRSNVTFISPYQY